MVWYPKCDTSALAGGGGGLLATSCEKVEKPSWIELSCVGR